MRQADKDRGANVADAAVGALGAVAGCLPWVQYQQLLGQFLRLMKKHAEAPAGKPVIRCAPQSSMLCFLFLIADSLQSSSDEEADVGYAGLREYQQWIALYMRIWKAGMQCFCAGREQG